MGIVNPVISADEEFEASSSISSSLKILIINQEKTLEKYNPEGVANQLKYMKTAKEIELLRRVDDIKISGLDDKFLRSFGLAQEKGAGAWLTALPVGSLGYVLNKEEFRDGIRLRYGWQVPNVPAFCVCEKRNSIDHTLTWWLYT